MTAARTRKYAVHGGYVISQNDGDKHHISAVQVARLYGLRPGEWIAWTEHDYSVYAPELIHLHPRNDGNYSLNREEQ